MSRCGGSEPPAYEEIGKVKVHQFFIERKNSMCISIQPGSDITIRSGKNCTRIFINTKNIPDEAHWETHNDHHIKLRRDDGKGAVYIFSFFDAFENWVTVTETSIGIEIDRRKCYQELDRD